MNTVSVVEGDLLDQDVDVIVNAWNRNIIPWWLLPRGVSGAIRRRGGIGPFKELAKRGLIPLGRAVITSAGHLPFKAIIHVAGINILGWASEWSIRQCVRNAMVLAHEEGFKSIAFPLIGADFGGADLDWAKAIMRHELGQMDLPLDVKVVVHRKKPLPWWFLGFHFIFYCLIVAQIARRQWHYSDYVVWGAILLLMLIQFIKQFVKQHAQYSIRTMLIVTFVVVVLCSIYSCFGFSTVSWLIMIVFVLVAMYGSNQTQ